MVAAAAMLCALVLALWASPASAACRSPGDVVSYSGGAGAIGAGQLSIAHCRAGKVKRKTSAKGRKPRTGKCRVPAIRGKRLAAVRAALKHAHCALGKVTRQSSARVARGRVISSRPKARTIHRTGTRVSVTISKGKKPAGPALCRVPDVVGMTQAAAGAALQGAHCALGRLKTKPSSKVAQGLVISSSPRAGSVRRAGSGVDLKVSSGPKPGHGPPLKACTVPQVAGMTQATAEAAIIQAGCAVGKVKTKSSSTVAVGLVIASSPKAGTSHKAGTKVKLRVSSGPKPGYPVPGGGDDLRRAS